MTYWSPDFRPTCSSSSTGTGFFQPAPIRHLLPSRPLVALNTAVCALDMYLMTLTVTGESSPSGRSSGRPAIG